MRRSCLKAFRTMSMFGIAMCLVTSMAAADPPTEVGGQYWLGLACEDLSAPLRRQCGLEAGEGLLVFSVAVDGPAATAGLELYDVLLSVNDQKVGTGHGLEQVWDGSAGVEVRLEVLRQGQQRVIAVTPQPRPAAPQRTRTDEPPRHGVQHKFLRELRLELKPLSAEARKSLPDTYEGGVEIAAVDQDSFAAMAGMRKGDIIVALENWQIRNLDDVAYVLNTQGEFDKFYLVRPGEAGATPFYGRMELAGIPGGMPGMQQEIVISRLKQDRSELLNEIASLELAMIDVRLPLLLVSREEITVEQTKEVRQRYLQLRDRKESFEAELLGIEAKLALAKRQYAELRSVDQAD